MIHHLHQQPLIVTVIFCSYIQHMLMHAYFSGIEVWATDYTLKAFRQWVSTRKFFPVELEGEGISVLETDQQLPTLPRTQCHDCLYIWDRSGILPMLKTVDWHDSREHCKSFQGGSLWVWHCVANCFCRMRDCWSWKLL